MHDRDALLARVRGGETVSAAARRLGIPRATVYSWKARHEDFSRELSAAVQSQRPPQREPIDWRAAAA